MGCSCVWRAADSDLEFWFSSRGRVDWVEARDPILRYVLPGLLSGGSRFSGARLAPSRRNAELKLCVLSDSHDHIARLEAAVAQAKNQGAEAVLHGGDVVAPSTLSCLEKQGLPVHVIHGNNAGDLFTLGRLAARPGSCLQYHGMDADIHLGGRRIFLVHYPHYARAMAATGDWDLVCCGHSHAAAQEWVPNLRGAETLLLNPGTVGGVGQAPATYLLGDTESLVFELYTLDRKSARFFRS